MSYDLVKIPFSFAKSGVFIYFLYTFPIYFLVPATRSPQMIVLVDFKNK